MDSQPDPARRSPRLADIAARAGVSKSLASLALRGEAGVSDESRRRVLDAAVQLGRMPSAHALRKLEGPNVIGLVVTDLRNPFHADVLRGIERTAPDATVLVADGARDIERMRAHLRAFDALDVAGIVISSSWLPAADITAAASRRPVAVIGSSISLIPGADTVRGDLDRGIQLTVEHLVAAGHRRIGFVAESAHSSSRRRHAAYLEQLTRFMQRDGAVSVHVDDLVEHPGRLVELVRERGFTALLAANDMTAITLLKLATGAGLRVPEDVAITGYDNTLGAQVTTPELTSVDQPWVRMGARACELLRERALGRTTDRDEVVAPELVVRGSTRADAA